MRAWVTRIGDQSQKEKHRAQNIFPLSDPGDRFNPQRMNGEKRGDKNAPPKPTGDLGQPKEKYNDGDCVQQDVCEMVAARSEIVELTVDHVRDGRERMPVIGLSVSERFGQAMPTQSSTDQWISVNVRLVVVVYEIVAQGLAEDEPNQNDDDGANAELRQTRWRTRCNCSGPDLHANTAGDPLRLLGRRFTIRRARLIKLHFMAQCCQQ